MKTYDYAFRFTKEGDGWVITCHDLPEAISQAEVHEDRVEVAEGCLQAAPRRGDGFSACRHGCKGRV